MEAHREPGGVFLDLAEDVSLGRLMDRQLPLEALFVLLLEVRDLGELGALEAGKKAVGVTVAYVRLTGLAARLASRLPCTWSEGEGNAGKREPWKEGEGKPKSPRCARRRRAAGQAAPKSP